MSWSKHASQKDTELYCKLSSDFLNKLLLASVQKLEVIVQVLTAGGKKW